MRKPSRGRPVRATLQATQEHIRQGIDRLTSAWKKYARFDPTSVIEQKSIPHVEVLAAAVDEPLVRTFGADTLDYQRYSDAAFFDNGPFNYAYHVPIEKVHEALSRSKARSVGPMSWREFDNTNG
jgi:hypothetical protein